MRRRLSRAIAAALAAALLGAPGEARAQDEEGALFLLLPVGARAIGMGQAVVAGTPGSEAVWWNPAALARVAKREAAIHHSETFLFTGDALSLVIPSDLLGVLTASVNVVNFGTQELTDPETGAPFGELTIRNVVYAATYAATIGGRLNAGLTYKLVQLRFDCNPSCGDVSSVASTSALDAGLQYDLNGLVPITVGVAVRNFGPRLQVKDSPQADNLPTRVQLGLRYQVPQIEDLAKDLEVFVSGDVVGPLELDNTEAYVGADLVWRKRIHLRGGYPFRETEGNGPSVGFGILAGDLALDVARVFESFSTDAGKAPTYLSLRLLF